MRGVTLENLLPRSFKEVSATGNEPVVYNYLDGGGGFSGVPSTIIAPALLFPDVDIRRQPGKHRKPPVYPSPLALADAARGAIAVAAVANDRVSYFAPHGAYAFHGR